MFRSICSQIEERGDEVEALWGTDSRRLRAMQVVSAFIAKRMGWPSTRFIPQDPFWIVMWDRHSTAIDELAHEDVRVKMEAAFQTTIPRAQLAEWYSWSYGRVIDQLLQDSVT
jgi:hypothetical protein